MRRDSQITEGSAEVPFADNLIFYAPLLENDLADHISGISPTFGSGSCSYDGSKQAYRFVLQGNDGTRCLIYDLLEPIELKQSESYNLTLFAKIYVVSYTQTVDFCSFGENVSVYTDGTTCFSIGETHRFNTSTNNPTTLNSWHDLCLTLNGTTGTHYVDSVVSRSAAYSLCYNMQKCVSKGANRWVSIGSQYNNHSFNAYIKDVRIYNRPLSAQEVAQL